MLEYFKGLFSGWGLDKWAHLGIGGLACALITIITILQAHQMPHWGILLVPLAGTIGVLIFSFLKEMIKLTGTIYVLIFSFFKVMINSTGFSWMNILAAMLGCLLVEAAVVFGVLMGV